MQNVLIVLLGISITGNLYLGSSWYNASKSADISVNTCKIEAKENMAGCMDQVYYLDEEIKRQENRCKEQLEMRDDMVMRYRTLAHSSGQIGLRLQNIILDFLKGNSVDVDELCSSLAEQTI